MPRFYRRYYRPYRRYRRYGYRRRPIFFSGQKYRRFRRRY